MQCCQKESCHVTVRSETGMRKQQKQDEEEQEQVQEQEQEK